MHRKEQAPGPQRAEARTGIFEVFYGAYFLLTFFAYLLASCILVPFIVALYHICALLRLKTGWIKTKAAKTWVTVTYELLTMVIGTNTYVVYDPRILESEKNLFVISNHATYLDWIFIWSMLFSFGRNMVIYAVKKGVASIFFLRLGMSMLRFILLERDMDRDKETLSEAAAYLQKKKRYSLVFFPEGTFIDKKSKSNDVAYLKKCREKVPREIDEPFKHTLFPRVKGFNLLAEKLGDSLGGVLDCTIFTRTRGGENYPSEQCTIPRLITGKCRDLFTMIVCTPRELPGQKEGEGYDKWLYRTYQEKNKVLSGLEKESQKKQGQVMARDYAQRKKYAVMKLERHLISQIFLTAITVFYAAGILFGARHLASSLYSLTTAIPPLPRPNPSNI